MNALVNWLIGSGWHKSKLRGPVTNVTGKVNRNSRSQITLSYGYVATSGKLLWEKFSLELDVSDVSESLIAVAVLSRKCDFVLFLFVDEIASFRFVIY